MISGPGYLGPSSLRGKLSSPDEQRFPEACLCVPYHSTKRQSPSTRRPITANPEIYELLEAEGASYTIRLLANQVLQDKIGYLLKQPVGRPPHEVRCYYASFRYQAQR
jgi:hypothetical protein